MKRHEIINKVKENVPPTPGTPQPAKVQKINPDGTAEIVDNKGTVTKVNQKDITPDAQGKLNVNVPKPKLQAGTNVSMTAEEIGYDEISGKSAAYILRKLEQGASLGDLMNDFPELSKIVNNISAMHGLHPDDDFEEIENVLMNDLEDLASEYDKHSGGYYESSELSEIKKLSGLK